MLQGLAAGQLSWNYPAWSISVEFIAYLAFPFALPAIARAPNVVRVVIAALLFALLAWLSALTKGDLDQWDGLITLVRCMPEFLLGTLLYFAFRDYGERFWLSSDLAVLAILPATLLGLHFGAPDLLIVSLFVALVLLAVSNTGGFAKLVNTGPLIWLGEISYSLYLVHGLIQFAFSKSLRRFWRPAHRCPLHWPIPRSNDADARAVHLLRKRYVFRCRDRLATTSPDTAN